ncbi:MAG: glycosyltransferase, partial [Candidatus Riflebacteria bacterium]|nr:glycosyltransferase [Candidatus Riflebacteria bacterium]
MTRRASVVVATHDGAGVIAACLEALCSQDLPADAYEVVVVDDGSRDGVHEVAWSVARAHPQIEVRIVRLPVNEGLSAARNAGIASSSGQVVLFTDDDAIPDPDWVRRILEAYRPGIDGVGGYWRPLADTVFARYALARTYLDYGRRAETVDGAGGQNMSFSRSALTAVGAFDPLFTTVSDDADLNRRMVRAGRRLLVLPRITVRHRTAGDLATFCSKMYARGAGARTFHE